MDSQRFYRRNTLSDLVGVVAIALFGTGMLSAAITMESVSKRITCALLGIMIFPVLWKWIRNVFSVKYIELSENGISVISPREQTAAFYDFPDSIRKAEFVGGNSRIVLRLCTDDAPAFVLASWRFEEEENLVAQLTEIIATYTSSQKAGGE